MADDTTDAPAAAAPSGLPGLIARVLKLKPVRVFLHYSSVHGPLLASGLTYQAIFAVFAGIWVAFSIAALVIGNDTGLRGQFVQTLSTAVPGLIQDGSGRGAIDPDVLLNVGALSWTGALALVGLLLTALGWLASARDSVRTIFDVGPVSTPFIILKLKDLGLAVGFGAVMILSTLLSAATTALLGPLLGALGFDRDSAGATVVGTVVGALVVLVIDTTVLAGLFRVLSGIPIPFRRLIGGALIGGIGLGLLKTLGGSLIGGGGSNPLLKSFAVIVGLLLFFNFVCQVILLSAAWIAVGMKDEGIAADPVAAEKERLERERVAELERLAAEARRPRGLARLLRRRREKIAGPLPSTADAEKVGAPE
jgi:membrane protein